MPCMYTSWLNSHIWSNMIRIWSNVQFAKCALHLDFSFISTLIPGSEKSTERPFVPRKVSFCGTFAPWNFCACGTFVPREWTFQKLSHPGTFVPVELSFLENEYSKNVHSKCQKRSQTLTINVITIISRMWWFLATKISLGIVALVQRR